ncbi:MAG: peptidoglycan DD-metalloendopeptidase family protein [Candidatus Ancillula sp.]|nr:peptidoglycan DD-metalloendopeptidase family protein [Candidatus Ancillula sp.]
MLNSNCKSSIKNKIYSALYIFLILLLLFAYPKFAISYDANSPDEVYKANTQNQKSLANTNSAIDGVSSTITHVEAEVDDLEKNTIPAADAALKVANDNYSKAQEKSQKIDRRMEAAAKDKDRIEKQLDLATKQVDAQKMAVAVNAREELHGDNEFQSLNLFFSASSSDDFIKNLEERENDAKMSSRLLNIAAASKADALGKDARLVIVNNLIEDLKKQSDESQIALKQAKEQAESWSNQLEGMKAQLVEKQANLQVQKQNLEAQKAAQQAEAQKIAADMAALASKGADYDGSGGIFSYPTTYHHITAPYGYDPTHPYVANHTGTDFGAPCGAPIFAAADGKVEMANISYNEGGALRVVLNHGVTNGVSWLTRYYHLSSFAVSAGQWVSRGQVIGYVGSTGWSTGCHLHFEVWKNGHHIDPMTVL